MRVKITAHAVAGLSTKCELGLRDASRKIIHFGLMAAEPAVRRWYACAILFIID
jgi:hypothetical protein